MTEHCTILVCTRNTCAYVDHAIRSALAQTYSNFDVLVVDDASTDGTHRSVLDLMPGQPLSMIRLKKHRGVTAATKRGIEKAMGPLITILDSDDQLLPNSLQVGTFPFRDSSVGYVWTKFRTHSGRVGWSGPLPRGRTMQQALESGWWKASHQRFFRKEYYLSSPGLDPSIDRSSDFQLCYLMSLTGCKTVFVPVITYVYRMGRPGSLSSQGRGKQKRAVGKIIKRFKKQGVIVGGS